MNLPGKWEFPGGKLEAGESAEACIRREIREELNLEIQPLYRLPAARYQGKLELIPFVCKVISGEMVLKEHQDATWDSLPALKSLEWAEADLQVIDHYEKYLSER
jgi:8-oxo-dGTP diphosphatase